MNTTISPSIDYALIQKNKDFLMNLYYQGPFKRHGFCCSSTALVLDFSRGDHTLGMMDLDQWVVDQEKAYEIEHAELAEVGDDRVPAVKLWTGTQIYAHAFGCEVAVFPDSPPAAKHLVETPEEADKLEEPDIWSCPNIVRIFELGRKLLDRLGPDTPLSPPDCQSGFDIASQIWHKEKLFCALVEDRESVHRLADKCARFFKKVHLELRKEFPTMYPNHCPGNWCPPEMGVWVSNDECGIMSNKMFREFMLPELKDLSQTFGGIGMHCCASAEHQFETFKEIPGWYAFNRVPSEKGIETLLDHFSGPDAPVHCLAWLGEDKIDWLIKNATPGMRFIFTMSGSLEDQKKWFGRMMEKYQ